MHREYFDIPETLAARVDEAKREGRVVRGGAWDITAFNSRCAYRGRVIPQQVNDYVGLRLACSLPPPARSQEE